MIRLHLMVAAMPEITGGGATEIVALCHRNCSGQSPRACRDTGPAIETIERGMAADGNWG